MTALETSRAPGRVRDVWSGRLIDCDVHAALPGFGALQPYLDDHWNEILDEAGFVEPPGMPTLLPPGAPTTVDPQWLPDGHIAELAVVPGVGGGAGPTPPKPASTLERLQEDVLDPCRVERAVLNLYWAVDSIRVPDLAAALAAAMNDWLIEHWLSQDDRLRASICVPGHSPDAIAAEIDRVGSHPGFVQVFLPVRSERLWGKRMWHPVFDAITRHDLVAGIHYGGTGDGPPTPTGWPSWFLEEYAAITQLYQSQLLSLVAEGVFAKFPTLRVSVLEAGIAWLPSFMWRADKEWKGLRREIPWVNVPPSALIRRHVRLSVQPIDAGPPEHFRQVLEHLDSDEMLMFCSDYPHGHSESIERLLDALPEPSHQLLIAGNAAAQYKL